MSRETGARDPYLVKSVVHASQVLSAFRTSGEALAAARGQRAQRASRRAWRFGCSTPSNAAAWWKRSARTCIAPTSGRSSTSPIASGMRHKAPTTSSRKTCRWACSAPRAAEGIELICVDNRYSPKIAQRNADVLVREKVDLVIEFQTDEHVAPIVAAKYREANIPLIAIEIPHPGATYYGANNYEAGLIGGRYLGRWAKQQWHGEADEIVLIALDRAGSLPKMRLTGMLVGMREVVPRARGHCRVTYLDGDGKLGESFEAMRRHLRGSRSRRILVGAINDPSALGALRAFQEAGRTDGVRHHGTERLAGGPRRTARTPARG